MKEFIFNYWEWIEAFHVIAVIAWMAGLLYLPRLFVYHTSAKTRSDKSNTFKVMERRLLRLIMNPAMVAVWVLGLSMLWANSDLLQQGWMHTKLSAVILMTVFHHALVRWWKEFERDERNHSEKFFRIANEVPTVLMVVIVIMVVVKPF